MRRSVRAGAAVVVLLAATSSSAARRPGCSSARATRSPRAARHPLARAVRIDKLSLAALEATLALYRDPDHARREIPVLAMLDARPSRRSRERARRLADATGGDGRRGASRASAAARCRCSSCRGPAVALDPGPAGADALAAALRAGDPPLVGRIQDGRLLLDPRTLTDEEADAAARGRARRARMSAGAPADARHRRATSTTARPRSSRALTGVDTDRLPEEKARGISIELGYAPLRAAERAAAVGRRRARPRALRAHDGRGRDRHRPASCWSSPPTTA